MSETAPRRTALALGAAPLLGTTLLFGAALACSSACSRAPREPLITYFSGDHALSIRYPSSWRSEQAVQDGVWYRYFLAPPAAPANKPAVSVTLLVAALDGSVDEYARSYLAGNELKLAREETRGPAVGKAFLFQSNGGATRHSLLLLKNEGRVYGLYAQGEAPLFERHYPLLEEMARSLTLERAADYPEQRNPRFGFALRVPASWKETRQFSGGSNYLLQYRSPALAADQNRDPVHASLTLTVEPLGDAAGLDEFYAATRRKLGESFLLIAHSKWHGGFVDQMRTETPVSASRMKRFYRAGAGRGYALTFEAREDVFPRVSRWCDLIAGTLVTGEELRAN